MFSSHKQTRGSRGTFALVWLVFWLILGGHFLWSAIAAPAPHAQINAESRAPRFVQKKIENIQPGDVVYAHNFETGKMVPRKVYEVHRSFTQCWVDIRVGREVITATRFHRVWVEDESEWIDAIDLQVGMQVQLASGETGRVNEIQVRELDKPEPTYNFEVEEDHNYFVGGSGFLVHNGTPHDAGGYWNYRLVNAAGETYYHGMAGPNQTADDVRYRHSNNNNRFNQANGDQLKPVRGTRTYGDSRRMEHERIIRDKTNIGRNQNSYRGNRQSGISQRNLKNYYDGC